MLSEKAINEFKIIYKKEFGKVLTDCEAQEKADSLLKLFGLIYKPVNKKFLKQKKKDIDK